LSYSSEKELSIHRLWSVLWVDRTTSREKNKLKPLSSRRSRQKNLKGSVILHREGEPCVRVDTLGMHLSLLNTRRCIDPPVESIPSVPSSMIARFPVLTPVGRATKSGNSQWFIARLDALRTCIQAGTYDVDETVLARCILINETHFLCLSQKCLSQSCLNCATHDNLP
jgi:hypothetical protein